MFYLITVLIPTFNNYKSFLKVANSYFSDKRVKIIVSDDSTDKIEKNKIRNFCLENNIQYINGPKTLPVKNWNNLMKKIDTDFFIINHHDDYPSNLKFIDFLIPNKVGLMVLPISSIANAKPVRKIFSWQQILFSKICLLYPNPLFNMFFSPTASLIISNKAQKVFFNENLKWFVDCEWYYRVVSKIIKNKLSITFFNKSRIISIQAKNSITNALSPKLKDQIKIEKNYFKSKGEMPLKIITFFQYIIMVLILLKTKFKQLI